MLNIISLPNYGLASLANSTCMTELRLTSDPADGHARDPTSTNTLPPGTALQIFAPVAQLLHLYRATLTSGVHALPRHLELLSLHQASCAYIKGMCTLSAP